MLHALYSAISVVVLAALTPAELGRRASPAVFRLETISRDGILGAGTGFVISPGGLMVTNHHVAAGQREIVAEQGDLKIPVSGYYGFDALRDLALIQLDMSKVPGGVLPHVDLAENASAIVPGIEVLSIGHPNAVRVANQTKGGITAVETSPHRLRFDAAITRGSSGSPLFSLETGKVIGVVTSFYTGGQEFNYATPVDYVHPLIHRFESSDGLIRPVSAYGATEAGLTGMRDSRLRNLFISGLVAALFAGWFFWMKRART